MIAHHNPEILRKIMIPISLKPCTGLENSATFNVDKIGITMTKENNNIAKRANEIITNEMIIPKRIIIANNKLRSSEIKMHNILKEKINH